MISSQDRMRILNALRRVQAAEDGALSAGLRQNYEARAIFLAAGEVAAHEWRHTASEYAAADLLALAEEMNPTKDKVA